MINILPAEEKKKIIKEYRLRLGVVVVFLVASLVLAGLVLLVPTYFLAAIKYNSAVSDHAAIEEKQGVQTQGKDVGGQVLSINKKINLLLKDENVSGVVPTHIVLSILNIKTRDIRISGLTYEAGIGQGRVVVIGVAANRDSLAGFVEALKKDPLFAKVELPISSYVKSENISFSIVIDIGIKK